MQAHELFRYSRMPELVDFQQYVRTLPTNTLMGFAAFAALTTFWYATRPKALKPPCDLSMQLVEVAGSGDARRSTLLDSDEPLVYFYKDVTTLYEGFQREIHVSNNGPCLGSQKPDQPYEWLLYKQWVIIEQGCFAYSMVIVLLYDTLGSEAITYIVNKAELSLVFVDKPEKAKLLLEGLKIIVLMDAYGSELVEQGKKCGVEVISMKAMEDLGRADRQKPKPPAPEDLAVVCFTSGTYRIQSFLAQMILITFLPLAHMFERVVECVRLCHGAKIGFFQGDIRLLLNRMFDRIFGQANTTLKRWLLDFAYKRKEAELHSSSIRNNSLWDKLIFHKIQSSLDGRVRLMVAGAALVSATVLTFLRAALGCRFYEGYGQTECTAGCCLTVPGHWTAGHVGAPMPCNLIKLVDVEEMNYIAAKGEGEVCVKGPNVFQGYLKDPAKTAEALDKDGWLHTGDIGKWLPNGTLKITDRKKHIFKLAQGEYIAPEKAENIYLRSEPVAQVFVHGESLQAFLIAIVVPDIKTLCSWAQKRGFDGSFEELCRNKDVRNDSGLKPFEQVKGIALHPELFSIYNGLLTPTMKKKRPELWNYFRSQIDELYSTIKV
uniref:Arachidonate--CoA ligase n=1 Tax=Aotus nancymaae TaxID=37293 RepID=A0A2K5ETF9_AOTNA